MGGVKYEGNWKIEKGQRKKHGWGKLIISVSEWYEGNWEEDKMEGFGVYQYPDGGFYSGEWHENHHEGRGRF